MSELPTESSARRKALRDFYKLQQSNASNPSQQQQQQQPADVDLSSTGGGGVPESQIDQFSDQNSDDYVNQLLKDNDILQLLKQENSLISELRTLNSEQKGLVYNNYNKLISASSTLQSISNKHETLTDIDSLKERMSRIANISSSLPKPNSSSNDEYGNNNYAAVKHAARWILSVEKSLSSLVNQGKRVEAKKQGQKAVDMIDSWVSKDQLEQYKELSLIRERCSAMLSVL